MLWFLTWYPKILMFTSQETHFWSYVASVTDACLGCQPRWRGERQADPSHVASWQPLGSDPAKVDVVGNGACQWPRHQRFRTAGFTEISLNVCTKEFWPPWGGEVQLATRSNLNVFMSWMHLMRSTPPYFKGKRKRNDTIKWIIQFWREH